MISATLRIGLSARVRDTVLVTAWVIRSLDHSRTILVIFVSVALRASTRPKLETQQGNHALTTIMPFRARQTSHVAVHHMIAPNTSRMDTKARTAPQCSHPAKLASYPWDFASVIESMPHSKPVPQQHSLFRRRTKCCPRMIWVSISSRSQWGDHQGFLTGQLGLLPECAGWSLSVPQQRFIGV